MLTFVPIQRTLTDADFSLTLSKGNSLSLNNQLNSRKVGNYTMFFAFCIRIDKSSDSMSEKACTKGKRKLHSHSKQIIMVLKALPYGLSTQALLRPQVRLCLGIISSPLSPPQPSHSISKVQLPQIEECTKLSHMLIYKSVHNRGLKLFPFGG